MNTNIKQLNAVYRNLPLSAINCYGDHMGSTLKGVQGRLSSILHWSNDYNHRNLAEYYILWVKANPNKRDFNSYSAKAADQNIFFATTKILELKNPIKLNTREIAHFIAAFNDEASRDHLPKILESYIDLKDRISQSAKAKKSPELKADLNAYIKAVQQSLGQEDWKVENLKAIIVDHKNAIQIQTALEATITSIKSAMNDGYIWESSCSLYCYLYSLFPVIETMLATFTASLLFEHFWVYLIAGTLAELTVTIAGGWNQKVLDDNSFHPFFDAAIGGLYITLSWLWIDKLEKEAQVGSLFYTLPQYGINDYVLKYLTMNCFFTLKAQLHCGSIDTMAIIKNGLAGAIRGLVKNPMIYYISKPIQWPLIKEIIIINITNFSKLIEVVIASPLAYEYRRSISILIAFIIAIHASLY